MKKKKAAPEEKAPAELVSRIFTEDVVTLNHAAIELQDLTGVRPNRSTLCRWIHRGCYGVKLEAVRVGGRHLFTSMQALTRFVEATSKKLS